MLAAFEKVPRERFVPPEVSTFSYEDTPLSIGNGQTISAPSMVAVMCQLLDIFDGCKILEIGTGMGYHAAVMSVLAGSGTVYTVERIPELAIKARNTFEELGITNVVVEIGDGSEGLAEFAPYDRISVAAAAPAVPPALVEQLRDPGRMVIPVGQHIQELMLVDKIDGQVLTTPHGGVAFVPLLGKYGFRVD